MAVYFAESCGYIKIGFSKNPFNRVGSITRHGKRPEDIPQDAPARLIGWVPGSPWDEGKYHARFIDARVAGEWFRLSDHEAIHELLWAHPSGVDVQRMSSLATLAMWRYPAATRDEIESAGIQIEATPLEDVSWDLLTEKLA